VDAPLRTLCGWASEKALPHESKFSRAFAGFAATELAQQLHAAVIDATQRERLIGHIARDSTAIPVRERFPETPEQRKERKARKAEKTKKAEKAKKGKSKQAAATQKKERFRRARAAERGTRIQRQRTSEGSPNAERTATSLRHRHEDEQPGS